MEPLPSMSYILKAQVSFSSAVPDEVTCSASMNSRKSMVPLLSVSTNQGSASQSGPMKGQCSPVGVEGAEDDLAEPVRPAAGEDFVVHVHELLLGQLAVGAVLHEACVPLLQHGI